MKYYLTTPIYYANGTPHIAHAYTTITADVIARYQKLKGQELFFLTGTDEHGTKIEKKAIEYGFTPKEFCDKIVKKFKKAWTELNINYSKFIRTTDQEHKNGAQKLIQQLYDKGEIYQKDYQGLYCNGCEKFITEKELIDGQCPDHKIAPELVQEKNYFFKLSNYLDKLKKLIETDQLEIIPLSIKKEILALLETGLEDFSISRESVNWGIEVPFDKNQKIYVWVEALTNYITALDYENWDKEKTENNLKKYWPANLHLVGKDIIKFHAIFWPAMLLALDLALPKKIFAHGYFTINGEKMSKTIGNIIEPKELIELFGIDATRYLILSQFAFGSDGDITLEKLKEQNNAYLANELGNLLQRTLAMINKYEIKIDTKTNLFEESIYDSKEKYSIDSYESLDKLTNQNFRETVIQLMENLEIFKAISEIQKLVKNENKKLEIHQPWQLAKTDKEKCAQVLKSIYFRLIMIAHLLEPFMPNIKDKMLEQLQSLKPEPLFRKVSV
jgi:methionyl-tRNA synthetase